MKKRKKLLFSLLCIGIIFSLTIPISPPVEASPATIYVPDDYSTIQAAVDAASPGDTIIVRDGIYSENVDVNKDHLTIQSENGADTTIVEAANPDDHVFEVTANDVTISGLTIRGATEGIIGSSAASAGVYLNSGTTSTLLHSNISSNTVSNNCYGILAINSSGSIMSNNAVSNNKVGVYLKASSENHLKGNDLTSNIQNFGVWGWEESDFRHDIDATNRVDGKPMYYLVGKHGQVIDSSTNAGYIAAVASTNIKIKDLTLKNNSEGVLFAYTMTLA